MQAEFRRMANLVQKLADGLSSLTSPVAPDELMAHFVSCNPQASRSDIEAAYCALIDRGLVGFNREMDVVLIKP